MNLKQINKRLFISVGVVVIIVIIIIIVMMVMGGSTKLSYERIEDKLKSGAVSYYGDHSELLPNTNGQKVSVSAFELEQGNYISSLQKMVKGDAICSGKVDVTKNGDNYLYSTYLNCGNDYNSVELYSAIASESNVVTTGNGLYKINDEFVFRGEDVNNYVKFGSKVWRIIKIDKTNNIKLIGDENITQSQAWDDRYNIERKNNSGINDYKVSRVKDYLIAMFNDDKYLSDADRANIAYKDACIGKRNTMSVINNNSVECTTVFESQPISLLQVNEYLNASLDVNCKKTEDTQCQNYNYLSDYSRSWWSLTGDSSNTHKVYKLSSAGVVLSTASSKAVVRPVIYLSDAIMFTGGDGTISNPYIVK